LIKCRLPKLRRARKRDSEGRFVSTRGPIDLKSDNRVILAAVVIFVLGPPLLERLPEPGTIVRSPLAVFQSVTGSTQKLTSEQIRKRDNATRLEKINPALRPKVGAILADLEEHKYQPLIDSGVWRSPSQQAAKVAAGVSKTQFSFHTATTKDGKPDALAADITNKPWGWKSTKENRVFWLKLASSAQAHGMTTGIYWGLSQANRDKLRAAIKARNWNYTGPLGWDTAHAEVVGISIMQAKVGKRPQPVQVPPVLVINDKAIRPGAAYLANGSWFVLEGELAPLFGKAAQTPSIFVPLRHQLGVYGHKIVATNNRLKDRNRFDVRTAPVK